jgi:two-component system chemotaxis sensor kinase CheA
MEVLFMDMNQYLDLFLEESLEHLQNLNQSLLALENNPERLDLLDEIFRAAHTLKGMSATMGYNSIAQLTHQMENLLDKLRERKLSLSPEIIDALFQCVDALEEMVGSIREGREPQTAIGQLAAGLALLEKGESIQASVKQNVEAPAPTADVSIQFNEYEKNLINAALEKGYHAYQLQIHIDEQCLMKGVRAFMVFRNLENVGEIIASRPSVQDIEDEKFDNHITVVLVTHQKETEIQTQLDVISEVKLANITPLGSYKPSSQPYEEMQGTNSNNNIVKEENKTNNDKKQKIHQTVRVDIGRLDKLMSLVGELVINKTRLEQIHLTNNTIGLNETIEQIDRIATDLQNVVQNVRMVSIEQVFNRFPRMVRDLAKELGKEVNLILEGKETELDRTVIDEIGDPLVHLIRNAIDHGLESPEERVKANKNREGMLKLAARHEGNQVVIVVEDDGKGINVNAIREKALKNGLITPAQAENMDDQAIVNLVFEPGFSTAQTITDISGRGVGLDVVKSKIQALSGQVHLETKQSQGTKFVIKLPLTLAIIQSLLVKVQEETFAIPLGNIDETTNLEADHIKNIQGQQVMVLRGKVLPLLFIKNLLAVPGHKEQHELYVVVVRKGEQQVGLVVDELIGQQEIVINSLGKLLTGLPGIAGASILGDGKVSLILDIGTLF